MEDKKKSLTEFIEETKFTDDTMASIFRELVEKHEDETERQHTIRAAVMLWMKKYPNEMALFEEKMKKAREIRGNEYAADIQQDHRHLFRIPESLWNRIVMVIKEPEFLSQSNPMTQAEKDEFAWFIKEFPAFVVPKKI